MRGSEERGYGDEREGGRRNMRAAILSNKGIHFLLPRGLLRKMKTRTREEIL